MKKLFFLRIIYALFLLFLIGQHNLNAQEINFNDPNITFKENNATISRDSANTLISTGNYFLKIKDLEKGKKEVSFVPKSSVASEPHSLISNFITKWQNKEFPDFELKSLDGKHISNNQFKDKVVVINFWFIQCKPCVTEMPELNKLVEKYKGKPVLFIAPSLDDKNALDKFFTKMTFDYQILPDAKSLADKMNLRAYPTHLIIDGKGKIKEVIIGGSKDIFQELDSHIQKEIFNKNL